LHRAVESSALTQANATHNDRPARVPVSIGVAQLDEHARDVAAILASADKALYHAKRTGRKRIAFSGSPVPCACKS
jgi:diguanylate cyclase (GGDEF)-like protein